MFTFEALPPWGFVTFKNSNTAFIRDMNPMFTPSALAY